MSDDGKGGRQRLGGTDVYAPDVGVVVAAGQSAQAWAAAEASRDLPWGQVYSGFVFARCLTTEHGAETRTNGNSQQNVSKTGILEG